MKNNKRRALFRCLGLAGALTLAACEGSDPSPTPDGGSAPTPDAGEIVEPGGPPRIQVGAQLGGARMSNDQRVVFGLIAEPTSPQEASSAAYGVRSIVGAPVLVDRSE